MSHYLLQIKLLQIGLKYEAAVFDVAKFRAQKNELNVRLKQMQLFEQLYKKIGYNHLLPKQFLQQIDNILNAQKPNQLKKDDLTRFITADEAKDLAKPFKKYLDGNGCPKEIVDPEMQRLSKFFTKIDKDLTIDEQRTRDNSETNSELKNSQIQKRLDGNIRDLKSRIQKSARFNRNESTKPTMFKYEIKIIPEQQSQLELESSFKIRQKDDKILNETFWRYQKYQNEEARKISPHKVSKHQQDEQQSSDVEFNWNIDDQQFEGRDYQDSDVIQYHGFNPQKQRRENNKTNRFKVKSKNIAVFKSFSLLNKKNSMSGANEKFDENKEVQTQQNFNFELEIKNDNQETNNENFSDRYSP